MLNKHALLIVVVLSQGWLTGEQDTHGCKGTLSERGLLLCCLLPQRCPIVCPLVPSIFPTPSLYFPPLRPLPCQRFSLKKEHCLQRGHRYSPPTLLCHPTQCQMSWASGIRVTWMPAAGRWLVVPESSVFKESQLDNSSWLVAWQVCGKPSLLDPLASFIYLKGTKFYWPIAICQVLCGTLWMLFHLSVAVKSVEWL